MKNFFTNLINRHQGKLEAVTPRAPSFYENVPMPVKPRVGGLSQTTVRPDQDQPVVSGQIISPGCQWAIDGCAKT